MKSALITFIIRAFVMMLVANACQCQLTKTKNYIRQSIPLIAPLASARNA